MFERLIELITTHASYGPAMSAAVQAQQPLVLNYHTHGPDSDYCVSIASKATDPLDFFSPDKSSLEELVHVRSFGKVEDECRSLCTALGRELVEHFGLSGVPEIYLNGDPLPPATSDAQEPHG